MPKIKETALVPGKVFYKPGKPHLYRSVVQVLLRSGAPPFVAYTDQAGKRTQCSLQRFLDWVNRP